MSQNATDICKHLLTILKQQGATHADVMMAVGQDQSVSVLHGRTESYERSAGNAIGLRAMVGQRQAVVSGSDLSMPALEQLAERVVSMAKAAPEDPFARIARQEQLASWTPEHITALALEDKTPPPPADSLKAWALEMEEVALGFPKISKSSGAGADGATRTVTLATSEGFMASYTGTSYSLGVTMIAGHGTHMVRDYAYAVARHQADLPTPKDLGKEAAERATRREGAAPIASGTLPVVFEARAARGLLGHFSRAVNGEAVVTGSTFLQNDMGKPVFAKGIRISDDPARPRGAASRPFDAEGLANPAFDVVQDGVLLQWFLDLASAAHLKLTPNGRASRGIGGLPGPSSTNLTLHAGTQTPDDLIAGIERGLWVTDMLGHGVNIVTGDYSRGAAGFLIENGKLTQPVQEVTIAGNLRDMFMGLTPANDLDLRYATASPTVRIDHMSIGGRS